MLDAVIIGGGVCGCAIARELSRKKGKFLVVEKEEDVCCGTSKANSGIVHAGFDAKHGTLMAKLNCLGSQKMPRLCRELDIPFRQNGSLVVMVDPQDRPRLQALYENGLANGVPGLQILERDALLKMEPNLSDQAVAALYAPTGGIICPFTLTIALAENAAQNGVKFWFNAPVTNLTPIPGGWRVETDKGSVDTRVVVNAAGVRADEIHNLACPDKMIIVPRRGEYFLLDKQAGSHVSHTIFQLPGALGKGVLVTPTVHGNLLVGPNAADVEEKDDVATTREGLTEVRMKSSTAVKNLPLNLAITSFSGLRAHRPEHEFYIRESVPGLIDCAGIESPGLSAAPAIGEMVAEMVTNLLRLEENPGFYPTRRGIQSPLSLSPEERQALIRGNPAYGRLICRCETVTEGEIVEAIHRTPGARSLDGVKRRVRAGMGRCQGGFCTPKVMEILARELGVPLEAVTKSGGESRLLEGQNKQCKGAKP